MGEINDGMLSPFQSLPEGCIAHILSKSLTSPRDACSASLISKHFKPASESDTVWGKFFPPDLEEIISNSVPPLSYEKKKELYRRLCHSSKPTEKGILISKGNRRFWLTKSTGKKCYMLSAWELSIDGKGDPNSWMWYKLAGSRFTEVPELLQVGWFDIQQVDSLHKRQVDRLDIRVRMPTWSMSLKTNYAAYLVFKTTENSNGLVGLAKASVRFAAATAISDLSEPEGDSVYLKIPTDVRYLTAKYEDDQKYRRRGRDLRHQFVRKPRPEHEIDGRVPHKRNDGWQEILLGEFFNDEGAGDIEIKIETRIPYWASGLILEGIEIRPKEEA